MTAGRDPDPVVVLAAARQRSSSIAREPDKPPTPGRHHRFAIELANLYTQTVSPCAAHQYAREVLDDAYRRAIKFHAQRLQQLAETSATRDALTTYLGTMRGELADMWRRTEAAHAPKHTPWPAAAPARTAPIPP